ncbi:protein O-mannose kinase-like [Ciona intestinalis]
MHLKKVFNTVLYIAIVTLMYFVVDHIQHLNVERTIHVVKEDKYERFLLQPGPCNKGWFRVGGMDECKRMLGCEDIIKLGHKKKLGGGIGKLVYSVDWEGIALAMVSTRDTRVKDQWILTRVDEGATNLLNLQPSQHVIQVAGFCKLGNQTHILTEKCDKYGNLNDFIKSDAIVKLSGKERLKLAIGLVQTFVYLHHGGGEARVNCDLHQLSQALSQYLVTNDMRIVMNDVDELPIDDVNNHPVCKSETGCVMVEHTFLSPEQRYNEADCKQDKLPKVSIKTDVWKIPNLTNAIMNVRSPNSTELKKIQRINRLLKQVHKMCKKIDPVNRWNSQQVLEDYVRVYNYV